MVAPLLQLRSKSGMIFAAGKCIQAPNKARSVPIPVIYLARETTCLDGVGFAKEEKDMKKAEFIDAVAEKCSMQKSEAAAAVDAVLDSITDALKSGDQVTLVGFGTFLVRKREARQGRNPRTGDPIDIPASNMPSFKAGKALKESVN